MSCIINHRASLSFISDVCRHRQTGSKMLVNNFLDNHSIEACRCWLFSSTEIELLSSCLLLINFLDVFFISSVTWCLVSGMFLPTCLRCPRAQTSSPGELHTEDRHRLSRGSRGTSWPPPSSLPHLGSLQQRRRSPGTQTRPGSSVSPPGC